MGTGQSRQLLTNETGSYSFSTAEQGSYRVSVGKEVLRPWSKMALRSPSYGCARGYAMKVGATTESVQVTRKQRNCKRDKAE